MPCDDSTLDDADCVITVNGLHDAGDRPIIDRTRLLDYLVVTRLLDDAMTAHSTMQTVSEQ